MKNKRSLAWEKSCIETLIDRLHPSGDILEIGFGLGYFASHIQTLSPKKHIIIESDPKLALSAKSWAQNYQTTEVIQDTWQNALSKLGTFDLIFFNDFQPEREEIRKEGLESGNLALRQGHELIANITKQFPQLTSYHYSDSDIDTFYQQVGKNKPSEFSLFLYELKQNKQISDEQYDKIIKKHHLEVKERPSTPILPDPTFVLFEQCLKSHMKKGSLFACFSSCAVSKYESSHFFEKVITNPHLDYQEKVLSTEEPDSCKALTLVIEKLS